MKRGDTLALAAVAVATLAGLALVFFGSIEPEDELPVLHFESQEEQHLHQLLEQELGSFLEPMLPAGWPIGSERLAAGRAAWRKQCQHCHGIAGSADTPTAAMLNPRPRDFGASVVKFTSTEATAPPIRRDLVRTITVGIPYTAMSGFIGLPQDRVEALADYAMYLLLRWHVWSGARSRLQTMGAEAALAAAMTATRELWNAADARIVSPPEPRPPRTEQSINRGRELFHSPAVGCVECHGKDGGGILPDGSPKRELVDLWQQPSRPRDLRRGRFLGGSQPIDLYRRISEGIKGTPMLPSAGTLPPDDILALVDYVYSLSED